jgi:dTDP-4-dehydrorhamnose reductase
MRVRFGVMAMFLLVGGDSEIGAATDRYLRLRGEPVVATTRRPGARDCGRMFFDLSRPLGGWRPPAGTSAACIFAAVARIGACDADPVASAEINVERTLALIDVLSERGIYALFLSTDKVFDGETPEVPAEAPTCPRSEYGRQKARAEARLRALFERGAPIGILRLAKVVSPGMPLLQSWVKALADGNSIRAFDDMAIAPTPVDIVASAITALLRTRSGGIFQLSGPRDVTYAQIGRRIAKRLGADPALIEAVSAASLPSGSTPRHTTLDCSRLRAQFGIDVPGPWDVLDRLLTGFGPPRRNSVFHKDDAISDT